MTESTYTLPSTKQKVDAMVSTRVTTHTVSIWLTRGANGVMESLCGDGGRPLGPVISKGTAHLPIYSSVLRRWPSATLSRTELMQALRLYMSELLS